MTITGAQRSAPEPRVDGMIVFNRGETSGELKQGGRIAGTSDVGRALGP